MRLIHGLCGLAMAGVVVAGAPTAWACNPGLGPPPPRPGVAPPTEAEMRDARAQQQGRWFASAGVVMEAEVVELWDTSIPGLPSRPELSPGLNAILRPVAAFKGEPPPQVVINYSNPTCGWGLLIGTPARSGIGDRFVVFAVSAEAAAAGQTIAVVRRDDLLESATLATARDGGATGRDGPD